MVIFGMKFLSKMDSYKANNRISFLFKRQKWF